ncbi:MAG: 2'-5' RNA ligase family protein [Anaerolineaceae bacterium]|nr:2'-5' RNA ligase family protein [Anaerolineaceae bacterium]
MIEPEQTPQPESRKWRGVIALAPIRLELAAAEQIQAVLAKNGLKVSAWFHVSLRLLLLERHLEEALDFLPEIAARHMPFKIRVEGAAFFPAAGVLYLRAQPVETLKGLRREIFLRQGWPRVLVWLRNRTWIPHVSAAYQVGANGWAIARELAAAVHGQEALVEQITLRNWLDEDRCFQLGTGEESCMPLTLPGAEA